MKKVQSKQMLEKIRIVLLFFFLFSALITIIVAVTIDHRDELDNEYPANSEVESDISYLESIGADFEIFNGDNFVSFITPPTPELELVLESEEHLPEPTLNYLDMGGEFELPLNGSTGWAAKTVILRESPERTSDEILNLYPGKAFTILYKEDFWWCIEVEDGVVGFVEWGGCFINLPDIIPSIIYNNTNAYNSLKKSSGFDIPFVTGEGLYHSFEFNPRLGRDEFLVPAHYIMAEKLSIIQQQALLDGFTLIVYEVFRPYVTQRLVVTQLSELISSNSVVSNAINAPGWGIGAFIATGRSNHQLASAIDLSLGIVHETSFETSGRFEYQRVVAHEEFVMQSPMHELSPLSASGSWNQTEGSTLLREYFTNMGFRPVGSEWWHFDCVESRAVALNNGIGGDFFVSPGISVVTVWEE